LENFARFFPRLGNAGRRRVGDSTDITATWAGRVSARGGHVWPGGDLNEESRKTGTETFFSCFSDFLIQKACGFPRLLKTEVDQIVACRGDQPTPACGHPPKEETRNSSLF
jgi:hypothetical protein